MFLEEINQSLLLATEWKSGDDPTGWLMTEKFDGIRAFWTGTVLYSRSGRELSPPDSWKVGLPSLQLDGELWIDRGQFEESMRLSKTSKLSAWQRAKFCVFDSPELSNKTYEERIEALKELALPAHIQVVEAVRCQGNN
jgi:DNA ligase-1